VVIGDAGAMYMEFGDSSPLYGRPARPKKLSENPRVFLFTYKKHLEVARWFYVHADESRVHPEMQAAGLVASVRDLMSSKQLTVWTASYGSRLPSCCQMSLISSAERAESIVLVRVIFVVCKFSCQSCNVKVCCNQRMLRRHRFQYGIKC
jgi:hypothetical protein